MQEQQQIISLYDDNNCLPQEESKQQLIQSKQHKPKVTDNIFDFIKSRQQTQQEIEHFHDFQWLDYDLNQQPEINYIEHFIQLNPNLSQSNAFKLNISEPCEFEQADNVNKNPFQKNILSQVADNLLSRITRYGDVGVKLSRRTGAVDSDENKGLNKFYDSNDPFIDDSDIGNIKDLALIDSNFNDYHSIKGDLSALLKVPQYTQKIREKNKSKSIKSKSSSKSQPQEKIAILSQIKLNKDGIYEIDQTSSERKYEIPATIQKQENKSIIAIIDKQFKQQFNKGTIIKLQKDRTYKLINEEQWNNLIKSQRITRPPQQKQQKKLFNK